MSSIDGYKHKHLGFIECPSSFNIIYGNPIKKVAIYKLLEDIPNDEKDFDGKSGDILLGGGSGEAAALRITMPHAMLFFFCNDWDDFEEYDDIFKAFWTPTESYIFGEGYTKLGWSPNWDLIFWVTENVCKILIEKFEEYKIYKPTEDYSISAFTFFEKDFFEKQE